MSFNPLSRSSILWIPYHPWIKRSASLLRFFLFGFDSGGHITTCQLLRFHQSFQGPTLKVGHRRRCWSEAAGAPVCSSQLQLVSLAEGIKEGRVLPPLLLCNGCERLLLSGWKLFSLLDGSTWLFAGTWTQIVLRCHAVRSEHLEFQWVSQTASSVLQEEPKKKH